MKEVTLEELKTILYEMGIEDAYEYDNITEQELLDFYYDYGYDIYGDNLPVLKVVNKK